MWTQIEMEKFECILCMKMKNNDKWSEQLKFNKNQNEVKQKKCNEIKMKCINNKHAICYNMVIVLMLSIRVR